MTPKSTRGPCAVCGAVGTLHDARTYGGVANVCERDWHHFYDRYRRPDQTRLFQMPGIGYKSCRVYYATCRQCGRLFASKHRRRAICSDACKRQRAVDRMNAWRAVPANAERLVAWTKANPAKTKAYRRKWRDTHADRLTVYRIAAYLAKQERRTG